MSTAKTTKILLEVPKWGLRQEFDFTLAESILRTRDNGGWVLPEDSEFEFKDNGLRYRTDKKGTEGKPKGSNSVKGSGSSKQN